MIGRFPCRKKIIRIYVGIGRGGPGGSDQNVISIPPDTKDGISWRQEMQTEMRSESLPESPGSTARLIPEVRDDWRLPAL